MKSIIIICLTLFITIAAQSQKETFVRIFDETGNKTHKGFLTAMSDSSLTILSGTNTVEIPVSQIATIRLRRSFGHTFLISSLAIGVPFAILLAATADPNAWIFAYTATQGAIIGLFGGAQWGALIAGFRHRPVFHVNMKRDNWIKVKTNLEILLNVK